MALLQRRSCSMSISALLRMIDEGQMCPTMVIWKCPRQVVDSGKGELLSVHVDTLLIDIVTILYN